jgi:hypothetical protein
MLSYLPEFENHDAALNARCGKFNLAPARKLAQQLLFYGDVF